MYIHRHTHTHTATPWQTESLIWQAETSFGEFRHSSSQQRPTGLLIRCMCSCLYVRIFTFHLLWNSTDGVHCTCTQGQSAALIVLLPGKWPFCTHWGIWLLKSNETLDSGTAVKAHMYTHCCVNEWTERELLSSCLFPLSSCSINATPPEKVGADWLAKARSCCPLCKGQEVMDFGLVPTGPGQLSN